MMVGGNPENMREDLREKHRIANAELKVKEAEAALAEALNPPKFDPVAVATEIRKRTGQAF